MSTGTRKLGKGILGDAVAIERPMKVVDLEPTGSGPGSLPAGYHVGIDPMHAQDGDFDGYSMLPNYEDDVWMPLGTLVRVKR